MRKIFMFNLMTVDGYFEGPGREIDWHNVDAEFNEYAIKMLDSADFLIFGRVTYELMAGYWPTEEALQDDPIVAEKMNSKSKIVLSKTLDKADWNNTTLIKENINEEIKKIKNQPGRDMAILGSASIISGFVQHGLIDEFRIMVNPLILGKGNPLFRGFMGRLNLKLTESRTFKSGNVLLCYELLK